MATTTTTTTTPMRDGVGLAADVHLPSGEADAGPVLLLRTPYGRTSEVTLVMFELDRALERGYAVVVQDTRGRSESEGTFTPFHPDIDDGYDTIEWIARQQFCDGSVVMAGSSYLGATQWLAALSGHPALKAIAPALTASDYHEGWIYQGGAFQLAFNLFWALVHLAPEERRRRGIPEPPAPAAPVYRTDTAEDDWPAARASSAVAGEWLSHRPLGDIDPLHDVAPFYFDWLEHDDPRAPYWAAISPERNAGRIGCPVLAVSGWYQLFLRGAYAGFDSVRAGGATEAARRRSALVIGPWENSVPGLRNTSAGEVDFGPAAGIDFTALQLDFFDAVLGRAQTAEGPRVRYFTMGRDEWRDAAEWPPRGTAWTPLYAGADGRLSADRPAEADAFDETCFDPAEPAPTLGGCTVPGLPQGPRDHRALLGRPDVAGYRTEPLARAVEITGPVSSVVHLSSTAESADVVVVLAYEDADGRLLNICDGIRRVHGAQAEQAIQVDLLATSIEVPAGSRLHLLVHHSNFPRFDVNSGLSEHPRYSRSQVSAVHRVHRSAARATRVSLPIAGDPEDLFDAA
jgi:putative CocE/NonD family hydrolase